MAYDSEDYDEKLTRLGRLYLIANAMDQITDDELVLEQFSNTEGCHTTACALGWGIIKNGGKLGRLGLIDDDVAVDGKTASVWDAELEAAGCEEGFHPWKVIAAELGLDEARALHLFGGSNYTYTGSLERPTPALVAERLRAEAAQLIQERVAELAAR